MASDNERTITRRRLIGTAAAAAGAAALPADAEARRTTHHPHRHKHARELHRADVIEVSGQWIGPTQDHLAALAKEVGERAAREALAG